MNTGTCFRPFACLPFRLALIAAGLSICTTNGRAADVEIIAHRGGHQLFPENTCAAFRSCSGLVDRIEFDVRISADGALVLMHDDTVGRTTTGSGAVSNLTLTQLKALDAGSKFSPAFAGERVPTLAEALRALPPGIPALVDCKTGSPQAVVDVLRSENALTNIFVSCTIGAFLSEVHKIEPRINLCYVGSGDLLADRLDWLKSNGIFTVAWEKSLVAPELVARVHAAGMRIWVYPYSSLEIQPLGDMDFDGILIDNPRLAKALALDAPPSNAQLAQDLIAYWKLDDGLLDPAVATADDIESRSPGRLVGFGSSPTWVPNGEARAGGALRLDGIANRVLIPTNEFLDIGTNAVSLSLWVKLAGLPSQLSRDYASIYDSTLDAYSVYLDKNSRELRFKTTDSLLQAARPGIPEAVLQTGVWHHVVGVFDGTSGSGMGQTLIYLDGVLRDIHAGSDTLPRLGLTNRVRRGQAAAIGCNGTDPNCFFAGAVDDVAIWRRSLSPRDVRQIYRAGANGAPLENQVMTLWIADVYIDPSTADMGMDIRVEHGSLTNQALQLRGANLPTDPYVDLAQLQGGKGQHASFHVSAAALARPGTLSMDSAAPPRFFQVASPCSTPF